LGIKLSTEDIVEKKAIYKRSDDYDDEGRNKLRDFYNSSKIVMQLDFDFTQRVFTFNYYTISDIMSRIGGLRGSIMLDSSTLHFVFLV